MDREGHRGRPPADPRDRPVDDLGEVERLGDGLRGVLAGQLDHVAHEVAELLDLRADVVQQGGPVGGLQGPTARGTRGVGLSEQVEVGAQAGQRRAQLVTGVRDEPALLVAGVGERREHGVERRREPGQLVLGRSLGDVERLGDPGPAHVLGGLGQPLHRTQPRRGDGQAREGGEADAHDADQ